jgi:NAD+ synthase (glutamine-hydrolysing)
MKVALLPVDPIIGDFAGNLKIHQEKIEAAAQAGAELCLFPELSLVGYHPKDLLYRQDWNQRAEGQLQELHNWLQKKFPQLIVIVGTTMPNESCRAISPKTHLNVAAVIHGKNCDFRAKTLIPYYDVFHESRYFASAEDGPDALRGPITINGKKIGVVICEDSWAEASRNGQKIHSVDPTATLAKSGAKIILNLSASPFSRHKRAERRKALLESSKIHGVRIYYVNQFGNQDDLLFDGDAFVVDNGQWLEGKELASEAAWLEGAGSKEKPDQEYDLARMLEEGIRGYARKNGFQKVVLGLSGGIDSALVAVLAANAVGPQNVIGLAMPSKFSSVHSVEDAESLARNLGIAFRHVPIKMLHSTASMTLKPFFADLAEDATEENVQSRLRGVMVMAFSNKFRALALATGNKSEFAVGYSTLYGDMCGAMAPIGDLYKGEVYSLARFLNADRELIPERSFTKPPSAELRPNQVDQDTLPPYDILDGALRLFLEEECSANEVFVRLQKTFPKVDRQAVDWIQRQITLNEYKRKQAPPILRVSERAFGSGRVIPLTHRI